MPGITGQGTTYNLPNYVGELFAVSREDTPLLSAIGGLTGGRSTTATLFEWQGYDLRDPDANRQRLEGADAPAGEERVRFHANNVVEIHQESVEISYTKQGATGNRSTDGMPTVSVGGTVIPADELGWQITQQLKQISRDVEASFITGTYRNPTDNTTPRKTRGLIEAITTNSRSTEHTAAQLTADDVLDLAQLAWDNGGIRETETRTIDSQARPDPSVRHRPQLPRGNPQRRRRQPPDHRNRLRPVQHHARPLRAQGQAARPQP